MNKWVKWGLIIGVVGVGAAIFVKSNAKAEALAAAAAAKLKEVVK